MRRYLVGLGLMILVVVAFMLRSGGENEPTQRRNKPQGPTAGQIGDLKEFAPVPASAPGTTHAISTEQRQSLLTLLSEARQARLQEAEATLGGVPKGQEPLGGRVEPLQIENKTGSASDWESEQLKVLSELMAECHDLAKQGNASLSGAIGIRFTVTAEPEIGGLVDEVEFNEEYSTIEDPMMRECMQESLYALELSPPPEGVKVGRELTLRFDDD